MSKVRWLPRPEVTDSLRRRDVLVRSRSGRIKKATILAVTHDCEGNKCVKYECEGKRLTRSYDLHDKVTDFALR
jgi:hypothetical protein